MTYQTREEWLTAALSLVRAQVPGIASRIRVTCGFPSTFTRSGTLAECWPDQSSADGTWEIMVSPTVADPGAVFVLLLGQALHTLPGAASTGSVTWRDACANAGLAPTGEDWKTLQATEDLGDLFAIQNLGPYPHAEIVTGSKKVQTTRMLKLTCPTCGYVIRTTGKWLKTGVPTCHDGDTFVAEMADETEGA